MPFTIKLAITNKPSCRKQQQQQRQCRNIKNDVNKWNLYLIRDLLGEFMFYILCKDTVLAPTFLRHSWNIFKKTHRFSGQQELIHQF